MTSSRIAGLLRPNSIAVVGATDNPHRIASEIVPGLLATGFRGEIFQVNPRYKSLNDRPCYPSLRAIGRPIDHCVIAIGKERVLQVVEECAALGVKGATIISSGYAEMGVDGAADQAALVKAAKGMPFVGPNCLGFANYVDSIFPVPVAIVKYHPEAGDIGFLVQSGGIAYAATAFIAQERNLRFSYIINTGNSAGISYDEATEFLFADAATAVIIAAIESESCVAELFQAVKRNGTPKPVILFKTGRGATGSRMAASHTGALAGDYRLIRDLAEQYGIYCAEDIDQALGIAALLKAGVEPQSGHGIATLSVSGGNITLFADQVDEMNLGFTELSPDTVAKLTNVLPSFVSIRNPIDMTVAAHEDIAVFGKVVEILATDPEVRLVVPILTTEESYVDTCTLLLEARRRMKVPTVFLWTGGAFEDQSHQMLRRENAVVFRSASLLSRCLYSIASAWHSGVAPAEPPIEVYVPQVDGALTEAETFRMLQDGGVPVAAFSLIEKSEIASTAQTIGYPVMIKADSSETHISDRGGVLGPFRNATELIAAKFATDALPGSRVLVMRYMPGLELIVSAFDHERFGPVMMIGSGGILTEVYADPRFVSLPATDEQLKRALGRCVIGKAISRGHRGLEALQPTLSFLRSLSRFMRSAQPALVQIEMNPVTVGGHGVVAVDAAAIIRRVKATVSQVA